MYASYFGHASKRRREENKLPTHLDKSNRCETYKGTFVGTLQPSTKLVLSNFCDPQIFDIMVCLYWFHLTLSTFILKL